jgi:hypothetical protein
VDGDVEIEPGAQNVLPEESLPVRLRDRLLEDLRLADELADVGSTGGSTGRRK